VYKSLDLDININNVLQRPRRAHASTSGLTVTGLQPRLAEHTHTPVHEYRHLARAPTGAPVCGVRKLPEGGRRDTAGNTGGGLRDVNSSTEARRCLVSAPRSRVEERDWPLHDIVITNIVWCMAYQREVEGGGSYIAQ